MRLFSTLSNVNEATGQREVVRLITTQLRDGQLFYMIAVAPQNERNFEGAFDTVLRSVRHQRLSKRSHGSHGSTQIRALSV